MRRLLLIFVLLFAAVLALGSWKPGAHPLLPTATSMPTLLPDDFTLLPTFVPAYPCELQNVDVYDDTLCRAERVSEHILFPGDGVSFISHVYTVGMGCWTGSDRDIHELRVCNRASGAVATLTHDLVTGVIPSPDGKWLAFGTMNPLSTAGDALDPHVYRVRVDGTRLQKLDTQPFPDFAVGAPRDLRWLDDTTLAFELWDGTGDAGWHPYRLKADGSGVYEALAA